MKTINEIKDKIDWDYYYSLEDRDTWDKICYNENLSEEFIEKFADQVNWYIISMHQKLSHEFIEKFADHVHWATICIYQKLSEDFIRKFTNYVDWDIISIYKSSLSPEFINEFKDRLNIDNMEQMKKLYMFLPRKK